MAFFIISSIALIVMSTGCATQQPVEMSSKTGGSMPGFATLADANDPIDMASAPIITQAAVIRYSALKRFKEGRLDRAGAWSIQNCVDHAINTVNRGILKKRMSDVVSAQQLIKGCETL